MSEEKRLNDAKVVLMLLVGTLLATWFFGTSTIGTILCNRHECMYWSGQGLLNFILAMTFSFIALTGAPVMAVVVVYMLVYVIREIVQVEQEKSRTNGEVE